MLNRLFEAPREKVRRKVPKEIYIAFSVAEQVAEHVFADEHNRATREFAIGACLAWTYLQWCNSGEMPHSSWDKSSMENLMSMCVSKLLPGHTGRFPEYRQLLVKMQEGEANQ